MNRDINDNWYYKVCKSGARMMGRRKQSSDDGQKKSTEGALRRDLKFARLNLQPFEVRAGAKLIAVIVLICMCIIDIFILF
ncbi:MAG: hypothetical protein JSV49_00085, partial [Thermoplasmata archaeon]